MMVKIQCTSCGTDSQMSLLNSSYQVPYRCWKCKEYFTLTVEDNAVKSLVKLSADEYQKLKDAEELKSKFKRQF